MIRRFPSDWHTPTGYFCAVIILYLQALYLFLCVTTGVSVILGYFFCGHAWFIELCTNINSLNDNAKLDGNRAKMVEQISDIVEMHSILFELGAICFGLHLFRTQFELNQNRTFFKCVFRLFDDLLKLAKVILTIFFAWCLIVVCASLQLIQLEIVK